MILGRARRSHHKEKALLSKTADRDECRPRYSCRTDPHLTLLCQVGWRRVVEVVAVFEVVVVVFEVPGAVPPEAVGPPVAGHSLFFFEALCVCFRGCCFHRHVLSQDVRWHTPPPQEMRKSTKIVPLSKLCAHIWIVWRTQLAQMTFCCVWAQVSNLAKMTGWRVFCVRIVFLENIAWQKVQQFPRLDVALFFSGSQVPPCDHLIASAQLTCEYIHKGGCPSSHQSVHFYSHLYILEKEVHRNKLAMNAGRMFPVCGTPEPTVPPELVVDTGCTTQCTSVMPDPRTTWVGEGHITMMVRLLQCEIQPNHPGITQKKSIRSKEKIMQEKDIQLIHHQQSQNMDFGQEGPRRRNWESPPGRTTLLSPNPKCPASSIFLKLCKRQAYVCLITFPFFLFRRWCVR